MKDSSLILKSTNIFTATSDKVLNGFIAIKDNKISAIKNLSLLNDYLGNNTKIYDLGDKVICPGFVDVHCFFTGYNLNFVGLNLLSFQTLDEIIKELKVHLNSNINSNYILGHNVEKKLLSTNYLEKLNNYFPTTPIILFTVGCESCLMNTSAIKKYNFTPEECYPEAMWKLLSDILSDKNTIKNNFKNYMYMLNSRGITAIKEMGFDTFYGFTDSLKELEDNNELSLRVSFMSQPVGSPINLEFGNNMRKCFNSNFVKFSGYNRMTDGSISCLCADLKEDYTCKAIKCNEYINYDLIKSEVLAADSDNFRFSLHAQGDSAIEKVINIYKECKRTANGKLVNRHAITDLELSDPIDLEDMAKLGIIAEVYPQIQSLANYNDKVEMINNTIGSKRSNMYWNRRKMIDSGVTVSCGTDLPLLIPNISESIYNSVGGYFNDGGISFNKNNTISISELLIAWTKNGQYNLFNEDILGTLEEGKLADIAVLDKNIFNMSPETIKDTKVCLTIVDGKIVYENL